jgi:hypothetical protein
LLLFRKWAFNRHGLRFTCLLSSYAYRPLLVKVWLLQLNRNPVEKFTIEK